MQQEQRDGVHAAIQPSFPDQDQLKHITAQLQELQKKYDDLHNERSKPEDEEDPHQAEVEAWLTATHKRVNLKYRAQYAPKFDGKWVDQKSLQGLYRVEAGFVNNLRDGTRRPVAYLEHDTITVFSEGGEQLKGQLVAQGNIIAWGNDAT